MRKGEVLQFLHEEIIYSNKKDTSDFHGTVSFDPIKMSQQKYSCGLSKAVQNCVYIYHLGQMQCFRTQISIPVTLLTHDVTSASKLR